MTKWEDITIEKPKDPYKQNLPFKQRYGDYGLIDFHSIYTLHEENRDFRKSIQNEIVMEEMRTQNILGQHITDEADRTISEVNENTDTRATEIKQKIQEHHNYVVNTVYPRIQSIDTKVDNANSKLDTTIAKVNENKTVIDNIWEKIRTWI